MINRAKPGFARFLLSNYNFILYYYIIKIKDYPPVPNGYVLAGSHSGRGSCIWRDLNYKELKIEILRLLDMIESNLWFVKRHDLPPAEFLCDQQLIGTWRLLFKNNSLNQTI